MVRRVNRVERVCVYIIINVCYAFYAYVFFLLFQFLSFLLLLYQLSFIFFTVFSPLPSSLSFFVFSISFLLCMDMCVYGRIWYFLYLFFSFSRFAQTDWGLDPWMSCRRPDSCAGGSGKLVLFLELVRASFKSPVGS